MSGQVFAVLFSGSSFWKTDRAGLGSELAGHETSGW